IDLDDPHSLFRLETSKLMQLVRFYQKINNGAVKSLEFIDRDFWSQKTMGKNKNISIDNYFMFISYLQALGSVYSEKSHEEFDDYNRGGYRHLSPRIEKEIIVSNFREIFDVEHEVASELLNMLTFQP